MKRYTVAGLRERLAKALDEAEQGVPVIIERRGVRYRLVVESADAPRKPRPPQIDVLDPTIDGGNWTWTWSPKGLKFRGRRS
jgi:antitoxin (DNA-binding transcriptional repressor) of toxin-antitoxin stability system